ncbi:SURF1 family protein [Thermopolyspora sp. NPDC052614]|uniref:SURF1 family cytochrome oxidase biogenesis protein n=1 Tax=Thermopolyspora sp. NPDC052614 TaxID=3155682 RepID=UPI00344255BE
MYRFLLAPRWLAFHLLVLLVIPSFFLLGQWQFGRYETRSANQARTQANLAAEPVPLDRLTTVGGTVGDEIKFRAVTVSGRYDPAHELLVRRRPLDGRLGYYVLTPLITGEGQAVLVNRGWVGMGATAEARPDVPAPTAGEVTVRGRLRPAETEENSGITDRKGLPAGQILLINTPELAKSLPYRLYGGYVQLGSQQPPAATAPTPVPDPEPDGGGGLNLAYSVQWWLFIGIAIGGWFVLIRREARDRKAAAEKSTPPNIRAYSDKVTG